MKDFELKNTGNLQKKRSNKKLEEEAAQRIKETQNVTPSDYLTVTNPKKKNNKAKEVEPELVKAKEENHLGVPNTFYDLSIQEQSMLMFYLSSDFEHPITGKRTHMNIIQSYVSAYLDEDEIEKIWNIFYDDDGNVEKIKIKNSKKYAELQQKAMMTFNSNPKIKEAWNDLVEMTFGAEPQELIKNAILQDALYAEQASDKNSNRKLAVEILGMNEKSDDSTSVNVFLHGGGKELTEIMPADSDIVTAKDLEVDGDGEE